MKLYYAPGACSLADHIALIESELPFDTEKVDLKGKTTEGGSDYIKINPKGYVPALALEDGGILTENIAILSYIGDRSVKLMPSDDLARYRGLEALAYISTELHKGFKPFFTPNASAQDKSAAGEALLKRFALLGQQLEDRDYLLGEFSVADCYLFVMLMWAKTKVGLDVGGSLARYYDRLSQRPSVRQALADEGLA